MPSPDDPLHNQLLSEVDLVLKQNGFLTDDLAYHDNAHPAVVDALKNSDCFASHFIRTRSDRFAIQGDCMFFFDAKTSRWTKGQQFAIEAIPFLRAVYEHTFFQTNTLFCLRRYDRTEYGIWATLDFASQYLSNIKIPAWRHEEDMDQWKRLFDRIMRSLGLSQEIVGCGTNGGSGDPFVCLNVDYHDPLPTWRQQIEGLFNTQEQRARETQ